MLLTFLGEHEYNYDEGSPEGPEKWGSLSAEWKACTNGKSQSPIDIDTKKTKAQASDLKKAYKDAPAKISNKGHAIVVSSLLLFNKGSDLYTLYFEVHSTI